MTIKKKKDNFKISNKDWPNYQRFQINYKSLEIEI